MSSFDAIAEATVFHPAAGDAGSATPVVVTDGSHERERDVTLAETGVITGTVTDVNDQPVTGVWVVASGVGWAGASAVTDADGRYALEAVLGRWTVQFATTAGFVTYWGGSTAEQAAGVDLTDTVRTVDNIDVQLPAGGFVGEISTDTGGRSGLWIRAVATSGTSFSGATRSGGAFAIENLPAGTYGLFVSSPDSTGEVRLGEYATSATAATAGLVFDLPSGSVSALVRRNGEPATDQFLTANLVEISGSVERDRSRHRWDRRFRLPARRRLPLVGHRPPARHHHVPSERPRRGRCVDDLRRERSGRVRRGRRPSGHRHARPER